MRAFRTYATMALGVALAATAPRALEAQGPSKIISVNPFLPLAGYFQGEFEGRVRENLSLAVSGAYMRLDDLYTSGDLKLRFYPTGRALQGFGISLGVGYGRVENDDANYDAVCAPPIVNGYPDYRACERKGERASGATASVEAQYQWLLGANRKTAVTLGAGAKRFYVDEPRDRFSSNLFQEFVPTLRLTIGYAFR